MSVPSSGKLLSNSELCLLICQGASLHGTIPRVSVKTADTTCVTHSGEGCTMPTPASIHRHRGHAQNGLLLGVALATGLVLAAFIVARSLERIKLAGDRITVKGYAEERVVSDAGTWRGNLSARASDLATAYRKIEADTERVQAMVNTAAGAGNGLTVGAVNSQTLVETTSNGMVTGRVQGYELTRSLQFDSKDVRLIQRIASDASKLISEGVQVNSPPPQFYFSNLNDVKVRLIGAATKDSKLRAEQFAANSGVTVGPLRSASQGVFQITAPNSTDTPDYGSYDTGTVDKIVKAVVTVEYSVARK